MVTKYLLRRQKEKYKRIKAIFFGSFNHKRSCNVLKKIWNYIQKNVSQRKLRWTRKYFLFYIVWLIIFSDRNTTPNSKSHSNIITRQLIFVVKVPHDTTIQWYVYGGKVRVLRDNMYFLDLRLIFWFKPYDILSPGNEKWRCYINLWRTKVLMSLSL